LTALDLLVVHQPLLAFTDWESLLRSGAVRAATSAQGDRLFHYCTASPECLPEGAPGLAAWSGFLRPGEQVERQARTLWSALVPDAPMVYGLGAVSGSDGFTTRMQQDFFRALALLPREHAVHLLASLGVSRLIGREPLGPLAGLGQPREDRETSILEYSIDGRAPRTYLAERIATVPDTAAALERMADPGFRPGRDAVLIGSGPLSLGTGQGGEITDTVFASGEIHATVMLPAEGLWVVSGTWFPGWQATVDGAFAEVLRVNGIHRGVRVAAGLHHVQMRYRPRALRWGFILSGAALAALIVLAGAAYGRER
jgi:hypothetical protein